MNGQTLTPSRRARRRRILEAAERVFRGEGFRGASMERIAEAAGMSKATLYSYFPDKEAVFKNVARSFAEALRDSFETALSREGRIEQRIADALVGKHLAVFSRVRGSSHSREIFMASDQIAAEIFAELDRSLMEMLADALRDGDRAEPERIARVLFAASQGIAHQGHDADGAASDIRLIVTTLLRT